MIDLSDTFDHLLAVLKEGMLALATPVTADGVPYFFYTQEAFPYFTMRVGSLIVEDDNEGEEIDVYTYEIIVRVVIGHLTSDYKGNNEEKLKVWLPHLVNYINRRELLQSAAEPVAPDHLLRARVSVSPGFRAFANDGIGVTQIGTELTVSCEFEELIEQVYT